MAKGKKGILSKIKDAIVGDGDQVDSTADAKDVVDSTTDATNVDSTTDATTNEATEAPNVEENTTAPEAEPQEVREPSDRDEALSDMRVSVNVLIAKCDTYADLRNIRISDLKNTLQKSLVKLR